MCADRGRLKPRLGASLLLLTPALLSAVGGYDYAPLEDPPIVVRNGSNTSVVLDCAYTLPPGDILLHVKWFHIRSGYNLVFQWISGKPPQALGPIKIRVNLKFSASETENERYRALQILRPTVELSGEYRCKVTSARTDVTRLKRLVVYTSPREMYIREIEPVYDRANVTCHVLGIYPEPRVELFRGANRGHMVPIEGLFKYVSWRDGLYDVTASWETRMEHLLSNTIFECVMRIADTNYVERCQLNYSPGKQSAAPAIDVNFNRLQDGLPGQIQASKASTGSGTRTSVTPLLAAASLCVTLLLSRQRVARDA